MKEIKNPRIGNDYAVKNKNGKLFKAALLAKFKRRTGFDFMWQFESAKAAKECEEVVSVHPKGKP